MSFEDLIFGLKFYIQNHIFLGIVFFMLLYVIRPLFFIPASPFDVFAGMVFGPIYGFLVCSTSLFFSAMFSYWVGYLTGGIVLEKKEIKRFSKLKERMKRDTFSTTIMMRLIMLPYDLSNYICWVLRAPFIRYVAGTSLWVMPATAVFVWAGAAFYGKDINNFQTLLQNVNYTYLMLSSVFFIIIVIVSKLIKKKFRDISI